MCLQRYSNTRWFHDFDGTYYAFYRIQIENYMYGKNIHQPLNKNHEKTNQDGWDLLDKQILGVRRLTLSKKKQRKGS